MEALQQLGFESLWLDDPPDLVEDVNEEVELTNDFVDVELDTDQVVSMHLEFLQISLHQFLHPRASDQSCAEILEWIERNDEGPFTFKTCCQVAGFDYRNLRASAKEDFYEQIRAQNDRP